MALTVRNSHSGVWFPRQFGAWLAEQSSPELNWKEAAKKFFGVYHKETEECEEPSLLSNYHTVQILHNNMLLHVSVSCFCWVRGIFTSNLAFTLWGNSGLIISRTLIHIWILTGMASEWVRPGMEWPDGRSGRGWCTCICWPQCCPDGAPRFTAAGCSCSIQCCRSRQCGGWCSTCSSSAHVCPPSHIPWKFVEERLC